jgi:6-pyruvoyltetrahydropterin/6-carboxytetrahydropterin synthase
MSAITATKIFTFDCAHMLAGHDGLCNNVHGHTYKVEVTLRRKVTETELIRSGPSEGMIADFKDIKNALQENVFDLFDHAFIYNCHSTDKAEQEIVDVLLKHNKKVFGMSCRPTAENMCRTFTRYITDVIFGEFNDTITVTNIKVWETPTSYAEIDWGKYPHLL